MASGQEGDILMSKTAVWGDSLRGRNFSFNYDHLKPRMNIAFYEIKPWKLNFRENSQVLALKPSTTLENFPEHLRHSYRIP